MKSSIQFRLAARTDAAGKYNPNAPLEGNEDNMFVDSDLTKDNLGEFTADEVVNLSDKGCLMVVADGMGGMNAGEVASAIAIKTVMEYFVTEKLTDSICKDSKSRMHYLETVVVAADSAIKNDSRRNPDHEGMGSTIILAWLCDDEICLTWCGDSRAYLFRPGMGFAQVSKDHSYVQGLVDDGKITEVQAFDHPYGNIITRSLGDPDKKAKPDSKCFKVFQGDIFMLCSDGLSGVLRDRKTYNEEGERLDTENLEDIIVEHRNSMVECRDCLFDAAQRNDWYDNVTAVLCEIVKDNSDPETSEIAKASDSGSTESVAVIGTSGLKETTSPVTSVGPSTTASSNRKKLVLYIFIAVIAFGSGALLTSRFIKRDTSQPNSVQDPQRNNNTELNTDSLSGQSKVIPEESHEPSKPTNPNQDDKRVVKNEVALDQKIASNEGANSVESVTEEPIIDGSPEEVKSPNEVQDDKQPGLTLAEGNSKETGVIVNQAPKSTTNSGISEATTNNSSNTNKKRSRSNEEDDYKKCVQATSSTEKLKFSKEYLKNHKEGPNKSNVEEIFYSSYLTSIYKQIWNCESKSETEKIKNEHDKLMEEIELSEDKRSKLNGYVKEEIEKQNRKFK